MSSLDEYYSGGPKTTAEAFPPVCLRTHWDPTALTQHILPSQPLQQRLALDPRPSSKICTTYYNSSMGDAPLAKPIQETPLEAPASLRGGFPAQPPATSATYLPGGAASLGFPYNVFNPDQESDINLLNRPLTKCAEGRYMPATYAPATNAVEGASQVFGLSPLAMTVRKEAGCRRADDADAMRRSSRLFANPTRYDRTTDVPANLRLATFVCR